MPIAVPVPEPFVEQVAGQPAGHHGVGGEHQIVDQGHDKSGVELAEPARGLHPGTVDRPQGLRPQARQERGDASQAQLIRRQAGRPLRQARRGRPARSRPGRNRRRAGPAQPVPGAAPGQGKGGKAGYCLYLRSKEQGVPASLEILLSQREAQGINGPLG